MSRIDHFRMMTEAADCGDFRRACQMALALSDDSASDGDDETRDYYQARAQVYATLHQAEMALWIAPAAVSWWVQKWSVETTEKYQDPEVAEL